MASLADLERLLERVFERSVSRLFRTRIHAVQLERRVERAMERGRTSSGGRTDVPNRYRVRLHPADLGESASAEAGAEALAARLADAALAFARAHGYHLPGRPTVSLVADPSLEPGQVEVDAVADPGRRPAAGVGARPPSPAVVPPVPPAGPPVAPPTVVPAGRPAVPDAAPRLERELLGEPAAPPLAAGPGRPAVPGGIRGDRGDFGDGTQTLVFRKPAPQPTRAVLREVAPNGRERAIEVDGTVLTIGRANDNGLVVADSRVSRHHGRLQARRGTLVYTDLGSTNGSRVNGIRVDEIVLGAGDRLQVGDTILVVEMLPG